MITSRAKVHPPKQSNRKLVHSGQDRRDQICGRFSEIRPRIEQASSRHLCITLRTCLRLVASYVHVGGSCQCRHFGTRVPKNTSVIEKTILGIYLLGEHTELTKTYTEEDRGISYTTILQILFFSREKKVDL